MNRIPAFQAVLAGEHAAVYAYGVVGAQLTGTADEKAARQAYNLHLLASRPRHRGPRAGRRDTGRGRGRL